MYCSHYSMWPFLTESVFLFKIFWGSVCSLGRVKWNKVALSLECFEGAGVKHNIKRNTAQVSLKLCLQHLNES